MTNNDRDLRTFMQIAQDVAIAKAKLMPTTPDIQRRAAAIVERGRDKIAQMRREELERRPSNVVSGAIREWIKKLPRAEALAELFAIWKVRPEMAIAHRECEAMTLDDIHAKLEDMYALVELAKGEE